MKWILTFSFTCTGAIVSGLVLIWGLNNFTAGGLSTHGVIALVLGVTFSILLAVGLMAVVFYSNRSGRDEQARNRDDRSR